MPKHLLFVALAGHGHVNPTLPLVQELVRRGHRVDYATSAEHSEAVISAGARWVELPPMDAMAAPPREFGPADIAVVLRAMFAAMRSAYPVLREHCVTESPDVICYDAMNWLVRVLAEQLGLPAVRCIPNLASNEEFSLFAGFMGDHGEENPLAAALADDCAEFSAEHGVVLDPANLLDVIEKLNLVFIPREFQPAGDTFDERFHFIGPSLGSREHDESWSPSDPDAPVLFISLGTVFNDRPEFYRTCIEAFGQGPYQVAMSVGGLDVAELGDIPPNFDVRPHFPQPAVLRNAAAFVSHAGMNSTMESLYYGVGLITVPQMPEQAANAGRVQELGLGEQLDAATVTAESLRAAVARVTSDSAVRANLDRMRKVISESGGAVRGVDVIEEYLR
ncbi:macrolide family glycosyltransferase [Streptomyces nigrescens]|uniref:Glycosyl transferase n=1 Tax=Streptomyces nigrescens TaxID=1920 RepID=A0A640TTS2_STRNI|nr:macrolide family glycosyltransferase [Streptomyces libani]WAU01111.1 glycosyl transferase [Streptomyces libani subsp. libani]GFE27008.1 putative UDP-glucosyltransferase YjiC [Streptomyces libani subsp. libani]GGV97253.1 putative UDP-glucosyltransferase YjiC [Streptomyces libani subsp. libani]